LASYTKSTKLFEPGVGTDSPPLSLFEHALLKCLVSEVPEDVEYDGLSLWISGGKVRIICSASKVMLADVAQQKVEKAVFSCDLLNFLSIEKMVFIGRTK